MKTKAPDLATMDLSKEVEEYLSSRLLSLVYINDAEPLPQGPYFVLDGNLHQSWRLYPDNLRAFTTAVIPDDNEEGLFHPFNNAGFDSQSSVPVPSRLYTMKSPTQPLAGIRMTVKDNMHLKGVVTTLGSRSYAELYGGQTTSAEYVDILVQKGAFIIGKTKMSAFAVI